MTTIRLHDSDRAHAVDVVEMSVWAVLVLAGLAIVVWAVAKALA
jgi:hypothetical protein